MILVNKRNSEPVAPKPSGQLVEQAPTPGNDPEQASCSASGLAEETTPCTDYEEYFKRYDDFQDMLVLRISKLEC